MAESVRYQGRRVALRIPDAQAFEAQAIERGMGQLQQSLNRMTSFFAEQSRVQAKIKGEEFELGSGVNHSINEVANMFGKDYPRDYIPKRKGEYDKTLCTDTNAHKLLGWTPNKKLDEYIHDFVNNQK